jgi:hypothetical protein
MLTEGAKRLGDRPIWIKDGKDVADANLAMAG